MTETVRPWDDQGIGYVYTERAHLTALLAAQYPSVLVTGADPHAPDWPVLYVQLPTGQASWHIGPNDMSLFAHVQRVTAPYGVTWDGHTNDQKYARVMALAQQLAAEQVRSWPLAVDDATRDTAAAVLEAHEAGSTDRG